MRDGGSFPLGGGGGERRRKIAAIGNPKISRNGNKNIRPLEIAYAIAATTSISPIAAVIRRATPVALTP